MLARLSKTHGLVYFPNFYLYLFFLFQLSCGLGSQSEIKNLRSEAGSAKNKTEELKKKQELSLQGEKFTLSVKPQWAWKSGLSDASQAIFRYQLDDPNLQLKGIISRAQSFSPEVELSQGLHKFYLQEKLSSEKWSEVKTFETVVDTEAPKTPVFIPNDDTAGSLHWTWIKEPEIESYLLKIGNADFANGGLRTEETNYPLPKNLGKGSYTLHLVARDLAGNLSEIATKTLEVP